jgi:hypothetical protein
MPPWKRFGAGIRGKEEREEEKEEEEEEQEGLERFFLCFVSVTESWRRRKRNPKWSGKSEQVGSCGSCCCVDDALGSEEYKSPVVCFFLVLFWI